MSQLSFIYFKSPPQETFARRGVRGNALFLILIAVALFAALSYAVTQSGRGSGTIDRENAALLAARFADFGASVSTAVMRLGVMGCSDTQLNFATPALVHPDYWGGTSNTNAPADGSCDVFSTAGGGAEYWAAQKELTVQDPAADVMTVSSIVGVNNVGTTASDIILWIQLTNSGSAQAICTALNTKMGNIGSVTDSTTRTLDWEYARGAGLTFTDPPGAPQLIIGDDAGSILNGKYAGCIIGPTSHDGDVRILYFVVKAR